MIADSIRAIDEPVENNIDINEGLSDANSPEFMNYINQINKEYGES